MELLENGNNECCTNRIQAIDQNGSLEVHKHKELPPDFLFAISTLNLRINQDSVFSYFQVLLSTQEPANLVHVSKGKHGHV